MQVPPSLPDTRSASQVTKGLDWSLPVSGLPFEDISAVEKYPSLALRPSSDLLIGATQIRTAKVELSALRSRCNLQDDLTTDIEYFLSWKHPRNCRPIVLLLRNCLRLEAAVLLHEVCFIWLGTGLCCGGDSAGDGLLIAPAEDRELFLKRAIDELLHVRRRFHTVRIRIKAAGSGTLADSEASNTSIKRVHHTVKHRLPLAANYADMMAAFGLRTRRSLRTKRRQLEAVLRPAFFPRLAPEQAFHVMCYLRTRSSPSPKSTWYFESRRNFLQSCEEAFSMGLQSHDGTWLSILTGWRKGGTTYVDMQMNHTEFKRESISAVMRAFLLEHEIHAGQKEIVFVGGCSALLERYCTPEELVADLLVHRHSVRASFLSKAMGKFCDRSFRDFIYL